MDHSCEKHFEAVNSLCRICAKSNLTQKQKKSRKKPISLNDVLCDLTLIGLDTRHDIPGTHSFIFVTIVNLRYTTQRPSDA